MKKTIIIFLINLLIPLICFSQNILDYKRKEESSIRITESQLKQTNLIFLEHKKLLKRDSILSQQVLNLEQVYINYNIIDSLRREQLNICETQIYNDSIKIDNLNTKVKLSRKKIRRRNQAIGFLSILSAVLSYLYFK